jgi:hypothetical protein
MYQKHVFNGILFWESKTLVPFVYFLHSWEDVTEQLPVLFCITDLIPFVYILHSWEDVIEQHFSVQLIPGRHKITQAEEESVVLLREIPPSWSVDHDESLVHLMSQHIPPENDHLGSIKNFVESVHVSTFGVSVQFINIDKCSTCVYNCDIITKY